jgi:hypothetical protein
MGYQANTGGYQSVEPSYDSWPEGAGGGAATQELELPLITAAPTLYAPTYTVYGLLDMMSSAVAASAFSLNEKLRAAYAGSSFRVRRASDSTELDIGFTATGAVDLAALAAFCAGTDGFIVTVYDHTANGRNLTNATAAQQPLIWETATGAIVAGTQSRLCGRWDGTADRLVRGDSSGFVGDVEWGMSILAREHGTPGSGDRFFASLGSQNAGRALGMLRAAVGRQVWISMVARACVFDVTAPNVASGTYQYNFTRRAAGVELQNSLADTDGAALNFLSATPATGTLANVQNTFTSWGDGVNAGAFFAQIESDVLIFWSTYPRTTDLTLKNAWFAAKI